MESRLLQTYAEQAAAKRLVDLVRLSSRFLSRDAYVPSDAVMEPGAQVDGSDDYASAATWIGVFEGPKLLGCLRQSGRVGDRFELERMDWLPRFLSKDPHTVEISRVGVWPGSDERDILTALLQFSIAHGRIQGHSYHFVTGAYPWPGKIYVDMLGMQLHGKPLGAAEDADKVFLYYLDLRC